VRYGLRARLIGAACAVVSISIVGCAKAPTCEVSPVELEELREDIAVLEKDLKAARDRAAQLTSELAAKKADLEVKRSRPDELRARLEQIRRGSGRIEKPKTAGGKTADGGKETS
jgi:chromosome segregation ATPase